MWFNRGNVKLKARITRPLTNKVLVKTVDPERTEIKSVLVIPESSQEKSQEAIVLALGRRVAKDGTEIESEVKIGQRVIAHRYTGSEVKVGSGDYRIVNYDEIVCVLG
jgi:chaperonin GroES